MSNAEAEPLLQPGVEDRVPSFQSNVSITTKPSTKISSKNSILEKKPEEENEKAEVFPNREMKPRRRDEIVFLAYYLLTAISFTIVLPTSLSISNRLGGSEIFAGLNYGLMPMLSGILSVPNSYLISQTSVKIWILCSSICFITGHVIYGFSVAANTKWMVFTGRLFEGLMWGGPMLAQIYAARAYGVNQRTSAMAKVGFIYTAGFAGGPLKKNLDEIFG
jgi:MFS family permease